ncbi:MFS transporter [Novosphingobium sp.]|uniref:MFS transporter n=1 Tax=Novosphingobium sp. TaxID=1874826 RepID=UPI003BA93DFD
MTVLVALLGLAVLLNFVDRGAIGIAAPLMKADLHLTATQFGIAVSAFFWLYGPAHPLVGWLADRVSVYRLYAMGVAVWATSTLLTGFASGLTGLILLRMMLGLGESCAFSGSSKMIARHVPPERRGLANAVVGVGIALGPAVGTLAGGAILGGWGWRAIFILFGAGTLLWLAPWFAAVRALPQGREPAQASLHMPYLQLLSHRALWLMGLCNATANFCAFFVVVWLPLYLTTSRGFSIATMSAFATTTYVVQALSSVGCGQVSDLLIRRGLDEGLVRRRFAVLGQIGMVIGVLGIAYAASPAAVLGWLLLTGAAMGIGPTMVFALGQIYAGPRLAGSWIGWQTGIASISGIIGPIVTGAIVDATGSYVGAFLFVAGVSAVGALLFQFALPPVRQIDIH